MSNKKLKSIYQIIIIIIIIIILEEIHQASVVNISLNVLKT